MAGASPPILPLVDLSDVVDLTEEERRPPKLGERRKFREGLGAGGCLPMYGWYSWNGLAWEGLAEVRQFIVFTNFIKPYE